jgi:hypothetical protein
MNDEEVETWQNQGWASRRQPWQVFAFAWQEAKQVENQIHCFLNEEAERILK